MATILDVGLIKYFVPVFTFVFVWLIMFMLLSKVKIFGDNKNLNSFFSFIVAVLFMFVGPAWKIVSIMTPWFVVLFILIIFMLLIFMVLGVESSKIIETAWDNAALFWVLFFVGLAIFGYALSQMYGEEIQSVYGGEEEGEGATGLAGDIFKIIFHPKILGIVLILVIAAQAMRLLSQ